MGPFPRWLSKIQRSLFNQFSHIHASSWRRQCGLVTSVHHNQAPVISNTPFIGPNIHHQKGMAEQSCQTKGILLIWLEDRSQAWTTRSAGWWCTADYSCWYQRGFERFEEPDRHKNTGNASVPLAVDTVIRISLLNSSSGVIMVYTVFSRTLVGRTIEIWKAMWTTSTSSKGGGFMGNVSDRCSW